MWQMIKLVIIIMLLAYALPSFSLENPSGGVRNGKITIHPFEAQTFADPMLLPRPNTSSRYEFKLEGRVIASIRTKQPAVTIKHLPTNKVLTIQVFLDGAKTEVLKINLGKFKDHKAGLKLAYGYANWRIVE